MATISVARIGNMALSHIGSGSSIESITEDSAEANAVELWYDFCRLQVLEAYDWNFARSRQTLALHADDPPATWVYRYQYPSSCVAARLIEHPFGKTADPVPFEVELSENGETKSILTDLSEAKLQYTRDLTLTTLFSGHFVMTLSYLIAHNICFDLTADLKLKLELGLVYNSLLMQAPAVSANERMDQLEQDADWIKGRN